MPKSTEPYETLQLQRYDDYRYLSDCGLQVKPLEGKQCRVHSEHYQMATDFLRGRRTAEFLRDCRKSKQARLDKLEAFNQLKGE